MYSGSNATDGRGITCREEYCSVHTPETHSSLQTLLSFHKNFVGGSYHSKNIVNIEHSYLHWLGEITFVIPGANWRKIWQKCYQKHEDIFRQKQRTTFHYPKSCLYLPRQRSPGDLWQKTLVSINKRTCIGLSIRNLLRNMKWLYVAKWKIMQRKQAHITVQNKTFPGYTWIHNFCMIWNHV